MTGMTGKAGPKGLGIYKTDITYHLALKFYLHLVVFGKHRLVMKLVTSSVPETEGVHTSGILAAACKISPEDANHSLPSAYLSNRPETWHWSEQLSRVVLSSS